jgi:hypothetical protein
VKICADSKGTACPLDKCRDKCVAHTDFACAWYAHDAAKNDCYLYETCKNEAADADYTQYLLAAAPAAVAGATLSRFIWPPPICLLYICFRAGIDAKQTSWAPSMLPTLSLTTLSPTTPTPPKPASVPPEGATVAGATLSHHRPMPGEPGPRESRTHMPNPPRPQARSNQSHSETSLSTAPRTALTGCATSSARAFPKERCTL